MRSNHAVAAVCLAGLLLASCYEVEESITLERDLSGQASINATIDLGAQIAPLLRLQREARGEAGEPKPEEIAAARQRALETRRPGQFTRRAEEERAKIEAALPPGVRLLEGRIDERELTLLALYRFGFDDVRKLQRIGGPPEGAAAPQAIDLNLQRQPFGGFELADEGKTLLLSTQLPNPLAGMAPAGETPAARQAREGAADAVKLHFRLSTPFEVVDSNATRRDGRTLVWDLDRAAFAKLDKVPVVKVWARLRK